MGRTLKNTQGLKGITSTAESCQINSTYKKRKTEDFTAPNCVISKSDAKSLCKRSVYSGHLVKYQTFEECTVLSCTLVCRLNTGPWFSILKGVHHRLGIQYKQQSVGFRY